jgi:2-methylisocitrate lyase-like PEP mutase family enzyme
MSDEQRARAAQFRELHAGGRLLILANAWDAGSARLIESCGAPAIATTSAGLAWSRGHPDGDALPPALLVAALREIARVISVPLSADVEAGYADEPAAVAETVMAVVGAGAVGINLEDAGGPPDLLCAKIEAIRAAAAAAGADVFVNARTDVYLRRLVPPERMQGETLARIARYRAAGADGIFVPRASAPDALRALVAAADPLPLNVLAGPGVPAAAELRALGVRRLSAGSGIARLALGTTAGIARRFLAEGRSEDLEGEGPEYAAMNALLT